MKDISSINPKKILVCQQRQIGDVVLATPSVSLLHKKYPQAEIHVLTEEKCTQVFDNNPAVSHVWPIKKKELRNPFKALAFYWKVGRSGYDLVVDFQQLPRCRWVVFFSGAPVRLAEMPPWYNRWLYTNWPESIIDGYAAMYKAGVLKPLGIDWNFECPKIFVSDEERAEAKACLNLLGVADDEPLITIDASHRGATRKWPEEYYAKLIRLISEKRPSYKFFLLYGPGEKGVVLNVRKESGVADKCVMVERPGSLRIMAALIERAVLHIGNCSAPRHFAVAVGTQSIVMPGASGSWSFPSSEHEEIRAGLECEPCGKGSCDRGDLGCLTKVMPEDVLLRVLDRV